MLHTNVFVENVQHVLYTLPLLISCMHQNALALRVFMYIYVHKNLITEKKAVTLMPA